MQPQEVPKNYVRSVVFTGIQARISMISQQIMSRSNLEKVIDQFGLYQDREDMYLEDKIEGLRKRISLNISRARGGADSFSIKFKGSNSDRVMRIANTLASYFIDQNLKLRVNQAVGTREFLEAELEKTREQLEQREKRVAEYRAKHQGGLPGELESNLRTLDRLQLQLTEKEISLREARDTQSALQNQLALQKEKMAEKAEEDEQGM